MSSESQSQYGPDTYLLQLRDVDFPVRLRQYMKVRLIGHFLINAPDNMFCFFKLRPGGVQQKPIACMRVNDFALPVIHERRRFTDMMDEEIDD